MSLLLNFVFSARKSFKIVPLTFYLLQIYTFNFFLYHYSAFYWYFCIYFYLFSLIILFIHFFFLIFMVKIIYSILYSW